MTELSRDEFARRVLAAAMPTGRVRQVIEKVIGPSMVVGPVHVGPGGIAVATAVGVPVDVVVERSGDPQWDLRAQISVRLSVHVVIAGATVKYMIDVIVRTRLAQVLQEPCTVAIAVEPVKTRDVHTHVAPRGVPARLVGWIGSIDNAVAEQVVRYIDELIESPRVTDLRRIDVADLIARAWDADLIVRSDSSGFAQDET